MEKRSDLKVRFVDLSKIYNKNEKRVVLAMEKHLAAIVDWEPETLDIQDIYALALNSLPARYVQYGTIVFNEPVKLTDIENAVKVAVDKVRNSPTLDKDKKE